MARHDPRLAGMRPGVPGAPVEWRVSDGLVPYVDAVAFMEARADAIAAGAAAEQVWLVEHPPLYTGGTSAQAGDLLSADFPVHATGRGGQYTYHGPGQRVVYLNLDLARRGKDVRRFVRALEHWMIAALADLGVTAWTAEGRIGVWTRGPDGGEAKIGAIGVRVKRWVTMHGFSLNVAPDLAHFGGIVPCGIAEFPVTSLAALGKAAGFVEVDAALEAAFPAFLDKLSGSD